MQLLTGASLTGAPLTDAPSLGVVSDVVETSRHVCSVIAEISCLKKMLSSLEEQGAEIMGQRCYGNVSGDYYH